MEPPPKPPLLPLDLLPDLFELDEPDLLPDLLLELVPDLEELEELEEPELLPLLPLRREFETVPVVLSRTEEVLPVFLVEVSLPDEIVEDFLALR